MCRPAGPASTGESNSSNPAGLCSLRSLREIVSALSARSAVAVLLGCAAMTACTSPEATRQRGQGPGADIGNRPDVVLMHEGSEPFWDTPERIPFEKPNLAPAEQASELSQS
jgi:hypothetical protein